MFQQPLLVSVYRLGHHKENRLRKDFCRIRNKQTHCLHISAQQTNKLRLRESLRTDARLLCLGFTSLNVLPTCLLSRTSLCNFPLDISSISLETCQIFSRFNVIICNRVIFLLIFNFTLITSHNIMACDLESHAVAIKHCFSVRQPLVQCFL